MGKRKSQNQERKKKVTLVFDENKRKDFLCGFRKRKQERKKKAQEELQTLLKAERKRIKQENKESYKKLVVSSRPIPDIEQLLQDEYEDEDVNVKIVELSSDTLQKKNLFIGENKPKEKIEKVVDKKESKSSSTNQILGMGSDEEDDEEASASENEDVEIGTDKTKKEIKKMLKHQATKKIQKSKVFQMKNKLDRVKNKKKAHSKKMHMQKVNANPRKNKNNPRKDNNPGKEKNKKSFGKRKH